MQISTWLYVLGMWEALKEIAKRLLVFAAVVGLAVGLVWALQFVVR